MKFINRHDELARLLALRRRREGGFAAVSGRRRVGKTRLLVEWTTQTEGVYYVADQSSAELQRRYLGLAIGTRLPGFEHLRFPDWRALFAALAQRAVETRWRGPIVLDELPYLVLQAPELPSVLQQFVDHDLKRARLTLVVAGSSQRMMQGLVLDASAPLFGRAHELFAVEPLAPSFLPQALGTRAMLANWTAWGGIPRYWELAASVRGSVAARVDRLVLDPLGPLHREPDSILLEEVPSALEVRPVLDAIGSGVHRVSELAARMGRPMTSLARPLDRLVEMKLARREVPFDEPGSKRALYRIADPLFRMWFRVVAPQRGPLATMTPAARRALLARFWPDLEAQAWEELARAHVARLGGWGPAARWWRANESEWDVVAESHDRKRLLLGEAKRSASMHDLARLVARPLPAFVQGRPVVRVLFAASFRGSPPADRNVLVITERDVFGIRP